MKQTQAKIVSAFLNSRIYAKFKPVKIGRKWTSAANYDSIPQGLRDSDIVSLLPDLFERFPFCSAPGKFFAIYGDIEAVKESDLI